MNNLIETLTILLGVCIPLVILFDFFLLLKVIDWFYKAKEYDVKNTIKNVIEEMHKRDNK